MHRRFRVIASVAPLLLVLAGCRPEAGVQDTAAPSPSMATAPDGSGARMATITPARLEDVMETDPRYILGISYPPGMEQYPGLAVELARYAQVARDELMEAVEAQGHGDAGPRVPYDLTLSYDVLMETPTIVAVQAWGTLYTGGAHGNPLVARFVWLPQRREMLRAEQLIPDDGGWREISAFVRESLHAALGHRLDADELAPEDRSRLVRSGGKMIDEGTGPSADNFEQFEPVPGDAGRLRALRFVFPPYQVGPYSDGMQTVEVPASVLLPHVAPAYRDLFGAG